MERLIPVLLKVLGQASLHKGLERLVPELSDPIPALPKAPRQDHSFPYGDRPVLALLKALEQGPPIPALLKALGQVSSKHWDRSLVSLKNFQTSHLFFSHSHHFGLSFFGLPLLYFRCFALTHIFPPSPSSLTHFPSSSLLLYSKPTISFPKFQTQKYYPKPQTLPKAR